jgi:O-methyltransferase
MLKQILQKILARAGFATYRYGIRSSKIAFGIQVAPSANNIFTHGPVVPTATYSPWLADTQFRKLQQKIKGHTLVDEFRCYELWSLVGQMRWVPGDILEVGVWRGGTGAVIATSTLVNQLDKKVYLADTFSGVVKSGAIDSSYSDGEHRDTSIELVRHMLDRNGIRNAVLLQGIFPDDFADIAKKQFCFAHIDVDVFRSARDIVDSIWANMPVGALVVFDDYGFSSCDGITSLVNQYMGDADKRVIHNLNGHAVVVKVG